MNLLIKTSFIFFISISVVTDFKIFAQNPIVPAGVYIADPAAHVWQDGKLYVYGSRDESPDYYCSWTHHVLYTEDLQNWQIRKNVFSSKGKNDQVPYSDNLLYAPDCQYKDGTYYLYYCVASNQYTEGVATSTSPTGPFVNGQNINLGGINQIDPAVFIDDDGQGYYIWGQFTAKMAKLKPNMVELDLSTIRDSVLTESEHFFHEGGYMVKRNGVYYFIYAHMGRAFRPTCIGYATSDNPMGPFEYGGVIIDNDHSDPEVWNNHGSIVEYKGQWYVFYHRSTHGSKMMRKACVEPIYFNEDGSIDEVEMTSQGAGPPLDATGKIEAEQACLLFGNVRIEAFSDKEEKLTKAKNDDKAAYKYINFGEGMDRIKVRAFAGREGGRIDFSLDQPWAKSIGFVEIAGNTNKNQWKIYEIPITRTSGVHAVWMRIYGEGEDLVDVDWFRFE